MSDKPQIPTPDELTTPFIDALVSRRPKALGPINSGNSRYGDIIAGLKSETRLLRARLADEAVSARLPLATGKALIELARSEYWVDADVGAKVAVGNQIITRTLTNTTSSPTGNFSRGVIPQGFRFRKVGDPTASPPVGDAIYTAAAPVVIDDIETQPATDLGGGKWQHVQSVTIPVVCDRTGAHANTPYFITVAFPGFVPMGFNIVDTPFDPLFKPGIGDAAGGSDGLSDAALRMLATASFAGRFAPTDGALLAGTLSSSGVEHVAFAQDTTAAKTIVFATDASWGMSQRFVASVEQSLKDNWQGFGCQVVVKGVLNQRISVDATVSLVDRKFLSEITALQSKISAALRSYFDGRPDWYTWNKSAIAATIAGSDRRILTCDQSSVAVHNQEGNSLAEPPRTLSPSLVNATHYYLTDNATRISFVGP